MLLATDRNGEHNKAGMVILYMHPTAGHAALPGLNVTGNSSQPVAQVVCLFLAFPLLEGFQYRSKSSSFQFFLKT